MSSPLLPDNLRSVFRPTPWKERTDSHRWYLYCSSWPARYFMRGANCSSLDSLITRMSRGGQRRCYLRSQAWTEMMVSWALVASVHFFCLLGWVECGWWYALVLQHTHWGFGVVWDWNVPLPLPPCNPGKTPTVTWPLSHRKTSSQGWIVNLPTEICWGSMETRKCWKYFFQNNSLRLCFFLTMTTSPLKVS